MDTTWYALDRDGRVALFESGEEGSVPWAACRASWDELYDDIVVARITAAERGGPLDEVRVLEATVASSQDPVERQLAAAILAGDGPARDVYADWLEAHGRDGWSPRERAVFEVGKLIRPIPRQSLPLQWSGLVVFPTADDLAMFRSQHEYAATSLRDVDPRLGIAHALAVEELQRYAFDDFWDASAIRAAFLITRGLAPRAAGLYEFGCDFRGPYRFRAAPPAPLRIDDLPAPVRARIAAVELPRQSFAAADEIDPERLFDCQRYGA